MTRVKASQLAGAALDWAAATADGWMQVGPMYPYLAFRTAFPTVRWTDLRYSSDWSLAGPLLDREGVDLRQIRPPLFGHYEYTPERAARPGAVIVARALLVGPSRGVRVPLPRPPNYGKWLARQSERHNNFGWSSEDFLSDTALIAAMRCVVAARLGDEVGLPEWLSS